MWQDARASRCRADAGRAVWCRLGMVPPIGGAVHGGTVLPGGCGLACMVPAIAGVVPGGAVPGRRGSGDCAGPGEGACQKTVCWPGWLGRASGGVRGNGVWGTGSGRMVSGERCPGTGDCLAGAGEAVDAGAGVSGGGLWGTGPGRTGSGGAASGCGERGRGNGVWGCGVGVRGTGPGERCLGVRRRGAGNGAGGTVSGGAASGCGERERKAGAEAGYPSKDAGKLKRDGAARKQGMQGVGAAKGDAGEMLQEGKLRS